MELLIASIPAAIAAIASVACAWITTAAKAEAEKTAQDAKDYRLQRETLDKAKTKVLISTMEGVAVLLYQAKGEKLNGNVESALDNLNKAKSEMIDARSEITSKERS